MQGANFTVSLSNATSNTVTFTYATGTTGTATPNVDFAPRTYNLTFTPGQTAIGITLAVIGDLVPEPTETVIVTLSNVVGATLAKGTGTATILDNDTPTISINDITVSEGDSGMKGANFTASLQQASSNTVTFTYATGSTGTATPNVDFVPRTYNLTFTPGQTAIGVTLAVIGDLVLEPSETVIVNLSNVVNATVAKGTGTATIPDNDTPAATISINDVTVTEGDSGMKGVNFTVSLSNATTTPVTFTYATGTSGTATPNVDFVPVTYNLTFTPGQTAIGVTLAVIGDLVPESTETVIVNLSNVVGATVLKGTGTATILDND